MKALTNDQLMSTKGVPAERRVVTRTIILNGKQISATIETSVKPAPVRKSLAEALAVIDEKYPDDDRPLISGDLNKRRRYF
ncbi:hypothetical protein ACQUFY_26095 (plasmid) [Robbsia andropogonis]|uniref:hypothetical protein n=1 Tax=Robbsia andropogonis TaxID=28092 RepID=UPI003D1C9C5C